MGIATAGEGEREPSLTDRALVFVRSRAGRELLVSIVLVILSAIGARAATSTAEKVERRDVPANVQGGR